MAHKLLLNSVTQDHGDVFLNPYGNFKVAKWFRFFDRHKQVTRTQI